ncbi:DMT family transporter [Caldimonas tepidiphila]|uniref:DMT family transporter n=1 Tax=Caldimonas tepidiphila TaxID=2315841 RepID=UPI000E5C31AD|nr:DMT family transporter [Caldimonas tepidiphila]
MSRLTPWTAFVLTMPPLMWAGNAVVGRLAVDMVPPITLNALRWVLAFLILLPLGWRALRSPQTLLRRAGYLNLVGLLGIGVYNALQYLALHTTTPINVTLIASSMPVWMLLVGAVVYRERPQPRQYLGAALSLAGVLLVIARGDPATLASVDFVIGDLLVLIAIFSWAFYSWLLARPPAHMRGDARPDWNWAEFLLVQIAFGLLWSGVSTGVEWAIADPEPIRWTPSVLAVLAYVAIGPSLVAFRCWGAGVAAVGPATASFFNNLTPVFAATLSALLLGEAPRLYHGLAFVFIVAGIVVSSRRG